MDVKKTYFVNFVWPAENVPPRICKDIFGKLNELNISMQGKNKSILQMSDRIDGFRGKLSFWRENLSKANFTPFHQLNKFLTDNNINDQCSTKVMCDHLKRLEEHLPPTSQTWLCQSLTGWGTHSTVIQAQWICLSSLLNSWLNYHVTECNRACIHEWRWKNSGWSKGTVPKYLSVL